MEKDEVQQERERIKRTAIMLSTVIYKGEEVGCYSIPIKVLEGYQFFLKDGKYGNKA